MGSFSAFEQRSLRWIRELLHSRNLLTERGALHEDAALLCSGGTLAVCTDAHVAGVHFPTSAIGQTWPGYRAVQATLSDLAATGARPAGLLLSIVWPWPVQDDLAFQAFYRGMADAAGEHGVPVLGGNLSGGSEVSVHCTALGEVVAPPLSTCGLPGDILAVSGDIGDAALGVRLQTEVGIIGRSDPLVQQAIKAYQLPGAEIEWALTAAPYLRGATDVSDGLQAEIERLCRRSACAATVYAGRLPRSAAWQILANPGNSAELWGSDDYRILVAVAPDQWLPLCCQLEKIGRKVYSVGVLKSGRESEYFED